MSKIIKRILVYALILFLTLLLVGDENIKAVVLVFIGLICCYTLIEIIDKVRNSDRESA